MSKYKHLEPAVTANDPLSDLPSSKTPAAACRKQGARVLVFCPFRLHSYNRFQGLLPGLGHYINPAFFAALFVYTTLPEAEVAGFFEGFFSEVGADLFHRK